MRNMMPLDDQVVIDYLMGSLSDDESERLDALSVSDDEFAARLAAVQNDLVDAYVNGELSGNTLERFTSHYLSSPAGLKKVAVAEALRKYQSSGSAGTRQAETIRPQLHVPERWALALAALVVLAVGGSLLVANIRLQRQLAASQKDQQALHQREQDLQRQLDMSRSAQTPAARPDQVTVPQVIASFVLVPATRGPADISALTIPRDAGAVALSLTEVDDYPAYEAVIRDISTGAVIWRAARLHGVAKANTKVVSITLAPKLLPPAIYNVEVSGVPAAGAPEAINSYAFRVVVSNSAVQGSPP